MSCSGRAQERGSLNGCQAHAGILAPDKDELSPKAKKKFLDELRDELSHGTDAMVSPPLFHVGPPLPAVPFSDVLLKDIDDESKFPELHKNILGAYKKAAVGLDMPSDFKLLPICDPIALAFKLAVDISVSFPDGFIPFLAPNLPALAALVELDPPTLAAKFPSIPSVPPPIPSLPLPVVDPLKFSDLLAFQLALVTNLPSMLGLVVGKAPELALKIVALPELFSALGDIAFQSKLFGDVSPDAITQVVAVKVLARKVIECVFIAAIGTTLGSAPSGITGGIGGVMGYK